MPLPHSPHLLFAAVSNDMTEMEDIIEINNSASHLLSIHSKHFSHRHCAAQLVSLWQRDNLVLSALQQPFRGFLSSPKLFNMLLSCLVHTGSLLNHNSFTREKMEN